MTVEEYGLARRMWHQLEPVHAVFWYAPQVSAEAAGLDCLTSVAAVRWRRWDSAGHNAAVDQVVRAAVDAMTRRDWDTLRRLLHPYLRWTATDGQTLRGRNQVIAMLQRAASPAAPAKVELRDGQIYRWHCVPPTR